MKKFTLHWLGGKTETVEGEDIADAYRRAGFGAGALRALDYFEEVEEYDFPVWGTQGGGLVRDTNKTYIFVEKPDCPGLDVGDKMPEEWGIVPANSLAYRAMSDAQDFAEGVGELFEMIGDKVVAGTMTPEQADRFVAIADNHRR